MKPRYYLFHINGIDQPGITAQITNYFQEISAKIIDIEQTVTHGYLSLHFLLEDDKTDKAEITNELNDRLKNFKINIASKEVKDHVHIPDPSNRFVATIIADEISAGFISEITEAIAKMKYNIDSIRKLNSGGLATIELICSTSKKIDLLPVKEELLAISGQYPAIDLAIQRENLYRRSKRLVAFDMDSTLIQHEVIDELAAEANCMQEVAELTRQAMEGEIEFQDALIKRVSKLKGLKMKDLEAVSARITYTPGAKTLINVLKKLGFKIAIISGGFTFFANRIKDELGLHYVCANQLDIENGILTGKVKGSIVDATRKADLLDLLAQQEEIPIEQVVAIGDGANDLNMLKHAGLGIAFNAKSITKKSVELSLNQKNMTTILYLMGITDEEIQEMGFE